MERSLTLPFHPYQLPGGTFLLHFPWSCLHRTLSGILPCEARTFLVCMSFDNAAATIHPTWFFMVLLYGNVTGFSTLF